METESNFMLTLANSSFSLSRTGSVWGRYTRAQLMKAPTNVPTPGARLETVTIFFRNLSQSVLSTTSTMFFTNSSPALRGSRDFSAFSLVK
ncbi:hypothetical protein SKAU_G00140670 [Synaphobranchus kaupii]|uniref:Uncharacterized protein n=1 Tax=Synaphobranchus kaupii TaxID=118154 RepID=A0A9Q1FST0_SYNKA|nr:hypothetical protein SKAU_G00140670 [Synaphobranchus kaupii]